MANADFVTRIILQNQEFQNEIAQCRREIRKLKGTADGSSSSIVNMGKSFKAFGAAVIGSAIVSKMVEFGKASLDAYKNTEMLKTSFSTMLGNATQANALFSSIQQYANTSPYDTDGLAKASQLMLSYGINTQRIMPTLRMLGDIAMGDNNKLQSLALAFSQMSAAGKVCKQDLNQMVNAGFNPLQTISEKTGESIGVLTEKVSKGQISVQQIEQAFKDATSEGGKFYNMADNMSDTVEGRLASLSDSFTSFKSTVGETLTPAIKSFAKELTTFFDVANKGLQDLMDKLSGGYHGTSQNNYDNKTQNAINYAIGKGKGQKNSQQIYKQTLQRGISFEEGQSKKIDKSISEAAAASNLLRKINKNKAYYSKTNKDPNVTFSKWGTALYKGKSYEEWDKIFDAKILESKRTKGRIATYKKSLTDNPYEEININPQSSIGGAKGGNTHTEVIPQGSLKDLQNQLKEAQEKASTAVGEQAYIAAMETVEKIEQQIEKFKSAPYFAKYKSFNGDASQNKSLTNIEIGGITTDSLKGVQESIDKLNADKIAEMVDQFNSLNDVLTSFGGTAVNFQAQFVEIIKMFKKTNNMGAAVGASITAVGQSMEEVAGKGTMAKMGAIMSAIGQLVLGYAYATSEAGKELGPWGWIAFAASGLATLATTISQIKGYSQGGIINGGSIVGDHMLARVNAGEMILNGSQQKKLFNMLNNGGGIGANMGGQVEFHISGSSLKGVLRNYDKKMSIL